MAGVEARPAPGGGKVTTRAARPGEPVPRTGGEARFAEAVRRASERVGTGTPAHADTTGDIASGERVRSSVPKKLIAPERREGEGLPGQTAQPARGGAETPSEAQRARGAGGAGTPAPAPAAASVSPGAAAADALMPKLAPRMPASFVITFPPNAWPLIRAEGTRGPNGVTLRLTAADAKDEAKLKNAIAALRDALEASGHTVEAIVVLTDGR